MEGLVFFVDFSEFLLSIVLDDVIHVNLCGFEEGLSLVRVSMVSNFYLLALELQLFCPCVFCLFFCCWTCDCSFLCLFFESQLGLSFSSHLLQELLLVNLILGLLNAIQL